jgi:hypothetical protein
MKPADLPIREIFNRFYIAIGNPVAGRVSAGRVSELLTRPIDRQVFTLVYWIDQNTYIG